MFRRVKINLYPVFIVAGYVVVFLTFYLYLSFAWFVCIPNEWKGQPGATKSKIYQLDFVLYWATSSLALSGEPFEAYDAGRLASLEQEMSGKTDSQLPWFYPPTFMLMIAPLSLLSYPVSLAVWLASTLVCYLLVLRTINGRLLTPVLALAFPGIAVNFFSAQNGFLTGALMGGSLLLLNHAPIIAGILLALLSYKPHLACLAFVAFLAGRHWKALGSSIVSLACLVLLSIVVFGYQPWISFFHSIPLAIKVLKNGTELWEKMTTIFTMALALGFKASTAWIFQGIMMLGVMSAVFWVWSRQSSPTTKISSLVVGTILFAPYAFQYDLAILAIPATLVWSKAKTGELLFQDKIFLFICWFLYPVGYILGRLLHFPIYSVILVILFVLTLVYAD